MRNIHNEIIDYAIVSPEDYETVNKYRWNRRVQTNKTTKSEKKYVKSKINGVYTSLHKFILGSKENMIIDHINSDGLDNRRENLRFLTFSDNNQNRIKKQNSSSNYIGVSKQKGKFVAKYANIRLGNFKIELDAAKQYDSFVLLHSNGIAKTNGLINYEDIKDINKDNFILKRNDRIHDLPKHIQKTNNKYYASIMYQRKSYNSNYYTTVNEAMQQIQVIKEKIENIKKYEEEEHYKKEITRNENNQAVIKIFSNREIKECLVDDDKWHELSKLKWYLEKNNYIQATIHNKQVFMHRYLLNPSDNKIVDHINNIRYDNRKHNLRIISRSANSQNKKKKENCASKYIGVSKNKINIWSANINYKSKQINLGTFEKEIDAANAYNIKALEFYGKFASLNKIE